MRTRRLTISSQTSGTPREAAAAAAAAATTAALLSSPQPFSVSTIAIGQRTRRIVTPDERRLELQLGATRHRRLSAAAAVAAAAAAAAAAGGMPIPPSPLLAATAACARPVRVHAFDFSAAAVRVLRARADFDAARCDAFVADAAEPAQLAAHVAPRTLDFALAIFALSALSVPRIGAALRAVRALMRPGHGRLLLRDYGVGDLSQLRFVAKRGRCLGDSFYARGDGTRVYYFSKDALAALAAAQALGIPIEDAAQALSLCQGVRGRAEVVPTDTDYTVLIDYAHTPDGLKNILSTVCGFADCVPTSPSHFEAMHLEQHVQDMRGDIRDRDAVVRAMKEFRPDVVFHLAAQALVRKSYEDAPLTFEANMLGTLNMLEAVRQCPSVEAAVFITSDKCYRNDEWVWGYRETDHLGGDDPYSASKGCAEIIAHSYFKSFFKDGPACATVRAGNVIGGGDWAADRIVPDCARAWAAGQAVQIRSPWATRPWQLVLEPLSGYLWLGAHLLGARKGPFETRGEAYNFGPAANVNNTVAEVVEALALHWPGFRSEMDKAGQAGMKECTLLKLCCDKALAHLGWKATLTFEETIRFTAEWYHRFYRGDGAKQGSMLDFSLGQIAAYVNAAEQREQLWTK